MTYTLYNGDCLDILATLDTGSVDALICDPPAGISFMGRDFDHHRGGRDKWIAWLAERLAAARRLLKPGHYGLVWALPRVSHWTGMACEDAGFVVIDRVSHIFGQGFPKGKNKLKPAVEDWWLIRAPGPAAALHIDACRVTGTKPLRENTNGKEGLFGLGSRLAVGDTNQGRWPANLLLSHAPGCVPIGVKRVRGSHKPGANMNVAAPSDTSLYEGGWAERMPAQHYADADGRETVDDWRCAPGCAVRALGEMSGESSTPATYVRSKDNPRKDYYCGLPHEDEVRGYGDTGTAARFFPNLDPPEDRTEDEGLRTEWVCSPSCPIAALDEQSGELMSGTRMHHVDDDNGATRRGIFDNAGTRRASDNVFPGDTGGASRFYPNLDPPFYYAAKASRRERNDGCDHLYWLADDTRGSGYRPITRAEYEAAQAAGERVARGNMHPTVKNTKLLTWLLNLLTVPGDVVLDPFAGSGSIGVAALMGGRSFVGVEMDEDYISIAEARLLHAAAQPRQLEIAV